ncbi:MAG: mechanosensitive ion channel [Planctomycetota bacterium]
MLNQAQTLRDARLDLLDKLARGYETLERTLTKTQKAESDLTAKVAECRTFVTERVFGIRSSDPLWRTNWANAAAAAAWLGDVDGWQATGLAVYDILVDPIWPLALLLPLGIVLLLRRWTARALAAAGDAAARGSNVAYGPTLWAAVHTAIWVLPLPVLLFAAGSWLGAHDDLVPFVKGFAGALRHTALFLLLATGLSVLVRPKGLAEAHFRWQSTTLSRLRSNLKLLYAVVPLVFVLSMLEASSDPRDFLGTLGKPMLLGELAILTVLLYRLMSPSTGIIGGALQATSSALYRFRALFFVLAVGTALLLLTMAALGYDYTALQLLRRLLLTMGVVVGSVFVHAMILRRLLLERRRLQIQQAKERMEAAKSGDASAAGGGELAVPDSVDPRSLAERTQALLRWAIAAGFLVLTYQIWVDVLPALGILKTVTLWDAGTPAAPELFTLADVALALFLFAIVGVAARNGPALLELLVLQRLRLQPGERTAITTLVRYGILITGTVLAFNAVGIGWSKVQWLVAAVSVGLGFGLQEIFANFVSGLILLLEQPVRVGDIVSVGTTTGRVTRIRIRATTVQDWDRKELVVPNREFVTGTFVNWTLGDPVVRWTIPVGVAYGTDTRKALELLEEVARKSRFVLAEPRPEAVFHEFGDSTLNLMLRVFVDMNGLEYRWMTEVVQGIDAAFAAAGIEIAFPQRDVNIKLSQPTVELLRRSDGRTAPGAVSPR